MRNVVVIILSSLLALILQGCQNDDLKKAISELNEECPIDMGDIGVVRNVTYQNNNVIYTYELNESVTKIEVLESNPDLLKQMILLNFSNPDSDTKALLELMIKEKASVIFEYIGSTSKKKTTSRVSSDEISELLNGSNESEVGSLDLLKSEIRITNLQMPMEIEEGIVINRIAIRENAVVYEAEVNENILDMSDLIQNKEMLRDYIIENFKDTVRGNPVMKRFVSLCLNCDKTIAYNYVGSSSGKSVYIEVPLSVLRNFSK